jgi:hypothetical protein
MLIADGLGEGGAGSVASRVALSTIAHLALHIGRWPLRIDPVTASEIIERAEFYYSRSDAAVLLCTNGLTDVVDEGQIADVLALRRKPDEQCALLTELAVRQQTRTTSPSSSRSIRSPPHSGLSP